MHTDAPAALVLSDHKKWRKATRTYYVAVSLGQESGVTWLGPLLRVSPAAVKAAAGLHSYLELNGGNIPFHAHSGCRQNEFLA